MDVALAEVAQVTLCEIPSHSDNTHPGHPGGAGNGRGARYQTCAM